MAYTRPAANAANLTWVGSSTYTRPAANAANIAFAPSYQASGFKPVSFGTPSLHTQVSTPVTGFMPVGFGTPAIAFSQTVQVTGFAPVTFGAPSLRGSYAVQGFAPVQFGTSITLLPHAVGFMPAHFGFPGLAINVAPLRPVSFGLPVATQRNRVTTWRACHFGTPAVATNRACAVAGYLPTRLGHPVCVHMQLRRMHLRVQPYRLRPVHFGTPTT